MRLSRKLASVALIAMVASCTDAPTGHEVIHEQVSAYNTILVTDDKTGLRSLWFETCKHKQSAAKPGDPKHLELAYVRAMLIGLAWVEQPERVLFVGLGGGTLPTFLHHYYPEVKIDVVEIDSDVVEVAKRFFTFREDATLRVHVQDGRSFIERCSDPYDVIFLDAYGAEHVPGHLTTQEFLYAVRQALTPTGVAVANVWGPQGNSLYDSMVRTYQQAFEDVYVMKVRRCGNRIVIALPFQRLLREVDLAQRAGKVSREKQFRFNLADVVFPGWEHPHEGRLSGRVLTDEAVGSPGETPSSNN